MQCPECKESSPGTEWRDTDVYCEDCGDHPAVACPNCGECFDHVWNHPVYDAVMEERESR